MRNLLSANYGDIETLRADLRSELRPEIHVIAMMVVADAPPPLPAQFFSNVFVEEGGAPWENLAFRLPRQDPRGSLGLHAGNFFDRFEANQVLPATDEVPGGTVALFAEDGPLGGAIAGSSGSGLPNGAYGLHGTGNDVNVRIVFDREQFRPPLPPHASGAIAGYFSTLGYDSFSATPTKSTFTQPATVQDAVFDDYRSESLLLASEVADEEDAGESEELLEKREQRAADVESDRSSSAFDQGAEAALDALARERRSIDAVVAALHDIPLPAENNGSTASSATYQQQAPPERAEGPWAASFDRVVAASPAFDIDGGMVLLENSGDANSNAYDLTAVYFAEFHSGEGRRAGVEAALGVYQAIDIGASDSNVASRGEQPIGQPAGAAPASISAESAAAKKNEQRS